MENKINELVNEIRDMVVTAFEEDPVRVSDDDELWDGIYHLVEKKDCRGQD